MKSHSAAADLSPPHPAASPHMRLSPNPAGVRRRRGRMRNLAGEASRAQVPLAQRQAAAALAKIPIRGPQKRQADATRAQIPFCPAKWWWWRRTLRDPRRLCSCCAQRGRLCSYWGAKRAHSALGGTRKPALSQIQSQEEKRIYTRASSSVQRSPAWGVKRARSPLGGGAFFESALIRCSSGGGGGSTKDWANLGDGPAGLIAELALACDVADYVRFRAVCRPWRRCSPDPRTSPAGLDGRFLPRRWIMLDKAHAGPRIRRFLNVSTGECIRMDLPELAEHTLLALTPEGLLLLFDETTLAVRLLNPLTGKLIDLPPLTALLTPDDLEDGIVVSGVGLVADGGSTVVAVRFYCPMVLAAANPGDESWTVVSDGRGIKSTLPFAGRVYYASSRGVLVMDVSSDQQPPQLRMAVELSRSPVYFISMSDSLHLVDNGGELMLVHRLLVPDSDDDDYVSYRRKYEVYRVDLDAGILIQVNGLNGRALFMGKKRAISVSAETFPSVIADSIYPRFDCDKETWRYNLADGSSEPRHYSPLLEGREHPCSVVDCLCYCILGTGEHLA